MKDQTRGSTRSRRQHERKFKDDLIAQSLVPGASVAAIALKAGINANLLFKWRREHGSAMAQAVLTPSTMLPVCVIPDVVPAQTALPTARPAAQPIATVDPAADRNTRFGVVEIDIAGAQLRLCGVDEPMLCSVMRALRQSA